MLSLAAVPFMTLSSPRRISVLAFHDVPDRERFRRQVKWLAANAHVLSLTEACAMAEDETLPYGAVVLTFDDGDPTVVGNALPVLDEFGMQGTLFICPGFVDGKEPFWWEVVETAHHVEPDTYATDPLLSLAAIKQLGETERQALVNSVRERLEAKTGKPLQRSQITSEQLSDWFDAGHALGNHTWSHALLDRCEPEEIAIEIGRAHEWLVDRYGEMKLFAYPNGNYSPEAEAWLASMGYRVGLLFDHRRQSGIDFLRMSRVRVNSSDPLYEFKAKASGIHPGLRSTLGRTRRSLRGWGGGNGPN